MGTYSQAAVVPEWQLANVPDPVDDLTAAALPLVAITCWESLYHRAQVKAGECVLVHGGAGGTGHVAVQLAALRGARVAATVSSTETGRVVLSMGRKWRSTIARRTLYQSHRNGRGAFTSPSTMPGPK
jgi:NADPH2:quinone reductase